MDVHGKQLLKVCSTSIYKLHTGYIKIYSTVHSYVDIFTIVLSLHLLTCLLLLKTRILLPSFICETISYTLAPKKMMACMHVLHTQLLTM